MRRSRPPDAAAVRDEKRLIIVDEAQWLNRECIEYLRHLHDHPGTCFALLLVGGDGCWEALTREPMLRSRIHRQVRFSAMDLATVLQVIPRYHPVYTDTSSEVIADIDDRYAHGISVTGPASPTAERTTNVRTVTATDCTSRGSEGNERT